MAMLEPDSFKKIEKDRSSIHEPVEATYSVFSTEKTIFQIDTYGSKGREYPGKTSQSLQMDKEMAKKLIEILRKEFQLS